MASEKPLQEASQRRQPQQQRSQERVEKVLRAAAEVFWEVGYDAATTRDIARRANTAVGTLYRFFPNKLAIFHALEKQHRQSVEAIQSSIVTPEFMRQPLDLMIASMVETFAKYFEDLGPRVVYTQYYLNPEIFIHFDETVDYSFIRRLAIALRIRNPTLPIDKSELLAEVCHRSFNALFLSALRSSPSHRDCLYQELRTLLTSYLHPYDSQGPSRPDMTPAATASPSTVFTQTHQLNHRQQKALSYLQTHSSLTIQTFETLCPMPSRRTLQRDLKQLIEKDLLYTEGETNQLTYYLRRTG
ncbi:transcriptional regulator, TetR family protein [Synechococcus sp. PCC 7335]|uniref:TetR/AcrR family transcriptional regulator n=1 Tax=Synechococcus sp. (strain ATCC 29403 / PCC 7335) TaxID=91464 RepID=UPI00017EE376|nr:TetR/AcrR family transcriptional regulator [Synechococcus sp. PCC 7335]EDX83727.1 transcriptional regulator, TetR family protein [Synechococcus sp. PCC 7335]